jgi:hypothetical protein
MREKGRNGKFVCPCCGYASLDESSTWEICQICFWEDDGQDDPKAEECWGGPNKVSLAEGRKNYLSHGASDLNELEHVRNPLPEEDQVRVYKLERNRVVDANKT